uniref:UPAR/Ly6 domain-containing protein n=1 Tax=Steinernema glaseri TaxID=37863 RepID=A0A1I7XVZ9_9BILA
MANLFVLLFSAFFSSAIAIQCYSGSQLQVIECPSLSCIKQTLGFDTVRYCDGTGVSSICQTYRIVDSCASVPSLGFICCCSDQLCNSGSTLGVGLVVVFLATRFFLL